MAKQNRAVLKTYFNSGDRPSEGEFSDLIDSGLNAIEDKATMADIEGGTNDDKFLTSLGAKTAVLKFAPVKKVNGVLPNADGDLAITNVSGTANTITGSITKSQVVGLDADLTSKQNQLISGTNIKTINGNTLLGSGNILIQAPLVSGTNIKTINGNTLLGTGDIIISSGNGPAKIIGVPSASFTLANVLTAQTAFPTSCDVFTLGANKAYLFKGTYLIASGATTHTTAMGWALSGLTVTSMEYVATIFSSALNASVTTLSSVQISGITSKVLNTTSTSVTTTIKFEGVIRTGNGGTITPQITFSAAPGGTNLMKVGSFIEFEEVGSNTVEAVGTVS